MGRILANKTNVDAPDADYPYGRIRDNPGNFTGTPINELVYGDVHQFFARLLDKQAGSAMADVVPNDLPENDPNGFQFFEALERVINRLVKKDQISFIVSGGGATIVTGIKGRRRVPFKCKVTGWEIISDQSCSAVVDVWRKTYAALPATNADSILTGNEMTISAGIKGQNLALTPIELAEGDYLYYNLDSNNTAQELSMAFIIERVFDAL
jgi:hypothetical protein